MSAVQRGVCCERGNVCGGREGMILYIVVYLWYSNDWLRCPRGGRGITAQGALKKDKEARR